jgi:branched-chain amino acid transport system substrate-binding protein
MAEQPVRVFISYSWDSYEHKEKVLNLSNKLREYGIDCQIDRYHLAPPKGWQCWMTDQISESDFVLVICTKKYKLRYEKKEAQEQGRASTWEGGLIATELYSGQGINRKFIPILLSPEGEQYVPQSLQPYTVYSLFSDNYDPSIGGECQNLYRHLTNQPDAVAPQLGKRLQLPAIQDAPFNVGNDGATIKVATIKPTPGLQQSPDNGKSQERSHNRSFVVYSALLLTCAFVIGKPLIDWVTTPVQPPETHISLQENMSFGEKQLFIQEEAGKPNPGFRAKKRDGIEAFATALATKDYRKAVTDLTKATELYPNSPETLIYLNNAEIGTRKSRTIAVAVSIDSNDGSSLAVLRGVAQAQEEINSGGGINNVPLRVAIINDRGMEEVARKLASFLAKDSDILGVIGHFSSKVTLETRKIYNDGHLPSISATSTSVKLSKGDSSSYGFRVIPNDRVAAQALADYMIGTLKKQKVAIFYEKGDPYSESLSSEFASFISQRNNVVVKKIDIKRDDFNAVNDVEFEKERVEVLMVATSSEPESVQKALEIIQANNQVLPLLGGDGMYISDELLKDSDAKPLGIVAAVPWTIDANQKSAFLDKALELWGTRKVNWITAMSYDATQAFIEAIRLNSPNVKREDIQKTLSKSNEKPLITGASGSIQFSSTGDRSGGEVQLVKVERDSQTQSGYGFHIIPK